jgi:hypothetical protein
MGGHRNEEEISATLNTCAKKEGQGAAQTGCLFNAQQDTVWQIDSSAFPGEGLAHRWSWTLGLQVSLPPFPSGLKYPLLPPTTSPILKGCCS